jgi:hypothetical protein
MMERSCPIVKKNSFVYSKSMDERKKNIKEWEQQKQEESRLVTRMLEDLGESLLSRADTGEFSGDYQRICREIADSEGFIKAITEDVFRLKQTEEAVSLNERTRARVNEDLGRLYYGLGKEILEDPAQGEFSEPYHRQLTTLNDKGKSLEERIEALAGRDPANILVQMGRNTQAMLLRSSLEKNLAAVKRVYEAAGEQFAGREKGEPEGDGRNEAVPEEIRALWKQAEALGTGAVRLKEDRRKLADSLRTQGGPVKRLRALEKQIGRSKNELRMVCGTYGELVLKKNRDEDGVFEQDDRRFIQKIEESRNYIDDIEKRIEKTKASLAIDEERAAIAKMEKSVLDQCGRIAAAQKAVEDLEERIRQAEQRIEELKKIEAYGT